MDYVAVECHSELAGVVPSFVTTLLLCCLSHPLSAHLCIFHDV